MTAIDLQPLSPTTRTLRVIDLEIQEVSDRVDLLTKMLAEEHEHLKQLRKERERSVSTAMKKDVAEAIWRILVEVCGARNSMISKMQFINFHTSTHAIPSEWRFQGDLGFGGKFWHAGESGKAEVIYVTCYKEDKNVERASKIDEANKRLAEIMKNGLR